MSDLATRQYCTFYADGLFFGVEVEQVQEVIRFQPITRVPLAHAVVSGLLNLRGQIVTAVDLRQRLEMPPRSSEVLPMNVVLRTGDGVVSVLVDEIGDVTEAADDQFEKCPDTVTGVAREVIRGAYKTKDRLLLVLDTESTVALPADAR